MPKDSPFSMHKYLSAMFDNADKTLATIVYESGSVLYVCTALVGSIVTNPVWRIMKVDTTTGVIITWCDGNSNYDNLATSLAIVAALSYS